MLNNPHTGQRVQIAPEFRDVWPVHRIGDRPGKVVGIGNTVVVVFDGIAGQMNLSAKYLEAL